MSQGQRAKPRRPQQEFGEAIVDLAKKQWGSTAAVLKAMGYEADNKNNTLRLLAKGEGSDQAARSLLAALKTANVDIGGLPEMYADDESANQTERWREQWIAIGDVLHEYAPKIFEGYFDDLLTIARPLAKAAGAELEIFRAS